MPPPGNVFSVVIILLICCVVLFNESTCQQTSRNRLGTRSLPGFNLFPLLHETFYNFYVPWEVPIPTAAEQHCGVTLNYHSFTWRYILMCVTEGKSFGCQTTHSAQNIIFLSMRSRFFGGFVAAEVMKWREGLSALLRM